MSDFLEDDERIRIIKDLILEDEEEDERDFQGAVLKELSATHPFSPRPRSRLNEGFFDFSTRDDKVDCYYVREQPFKWDYADTGDRTIKSLVVKRVDPSYRVRITISFEPSKVVMTFFGGIDTMVFRAREIASDAIKRYVHNFKKMDVRFSPKAMRNILERLGRYVELINIDPRDNEKFTKIVEQKVKGKAEVRKVIVYDVFNVRMTGISIIVSPEVARLIEEEGIRLTEIRGGLWFETGIRITTKVKSNGRVEFIIPAKYFGNDEDRVCEAAVRLYRKIIPSDIEPEKGPLERFI